MGGRAFAPRPRPGSAFIAYETLREAMGTTSAPKSFVRKGNDDALLRWEYVRSAS